MQTHIVTEKHYTGYQYSMPFVLLYAVSSVLHITLLMLLWSLVALIQSSALLSCPRKLLLSALWYADICLSFSACLLNVFIHCIDCFLDSAITNQTQVIWCDWEICWHLCGTALKKSTLKPFPALCAHPSEFFGPILHRACDSLSCGNLLANTAWNLWKFTWKFLHCLFTHFLVNTLNKIITHYRQPVTSLFIVNVCFPIFE
jgi:hypothetical protein